jgi:hypothetical protein
VHAPRAAPPRLLRTDGATMADRTGVQALRTELPQRMDGPPHHEVRRDQGPRHATLSESRVVAPGPKRPRVELDSPTQGVWFALNVGRMDNADPRWLIPLICRRGHITKDDIGAIRVYDDITRFEVAPAVADRFEAASRRPDKKDPKIKITPATR